MLILQNGGRGVIEAEVKPVGCKHLVETLSIDCGGKELPTCTGNFLFLLPVSSSTYQVNIRFRALTGELLDEISKPILTHHQGTNLFDYCDGHSLPSVEFPISKKQPVGMFLFLVCIHVSEYFLHLSWYII